MNVYFCRSKGLASWIIRTFTMSRWNHGAIEIDGVVWQATASKGVHVVDLETLAHHYHDIECVPVEVPNKQAAKDFLRAQLGKPYDWGAVLGMFFRADWHDSESWYCFELIAGALEKGERVMKLPQHRVHARDLWVAL